ncbi:MAG: CBS domain-containing protein [Candidatus Acidiferrales bacterium]
MATPKLVREIMTTEVATLDYDAKLLDAALQMRSSGFRHLPVIKDGRLAGVISDRDVHRASPSIFSDITPEEYNRLFETTPIAKVMAREPTTVSPDTPVREVVQLMHENKVGSVPVVDGEKHLVGIVTTTDLLRVLNDLLTEA